MSIPRMDGFVFDEQNVEKFAQHGITLAQVDYVLYDSVAYVVKNRKRRRAQYLLVGRDSSGVCIAVPLERTTEKYIWRPVTAWRCKTHEERRLQGLRPRRKR